MATNLQPPGRLGKREGHNALAKSMGMVRRHYNRHSRTNTNGVPPTHQSI